MDGGGRFLPFHNSKITPNYILKYIFFLFSLSKSPTIIILKKLRARAHCWVSPSFLTTSIFFLLLLFFFFNFSIFFLQFSYSFPTITKLKNNHAGAHYGVSPCFFATSIFFFYYYTSISISFSSSSIFQYFSYSFPTVPLLPLLVQA